MRKVIVIGCPGAGKSTFARRLRDRTGLPLFYLDMLWHRADKTTVSCEEFDEALSKILEQDAWIIDGNYIRTLEHRLQQCDTVFFLDYPTDVCLQGAAARIGTQREDMPWKEEELDEEFKQWIVDFPKDQLPRIEHLLSIYADRITVHRFRTRAEAGKYRY